MAIDVLSDIHKPLLEKSNSTVDHKQKPPVQLHSRIADRANRAGGALPTIEEDQTESQHNGTGADYSKLGRVPSAAGLNRH